MPPCAMIDIRRGIMPDPRINIRITRHIRDLSIVVLMDLSESTNAKRWASKKANRATKRPIRARPDTRGGDFARRGPSKASVTTSRSTASRRTDGTTCSTTDSGFEKPYDDEAKSRLAP